MDGPEALGVGRGVTAAYYKTPACEETLCRTTHLDRFFGMTKQWIMYIGM
jgi:hypothetical protein